MKDKDGATLVSVGGKFSLQLGDKSNLGGLELVH